MDQPVRAKSLNDLKGVTHGFFTREGGVSSGIYESLNTGFGSKDNNENVAENRKRIAQSLGVAPQNLITPYQEHTDTAVIATTPWPRDKAPIADAIVTNEPNLAVGILTADCAPVLFADNDARIVAAAHSGWRGAIGGILNATVEKMEALGASRDRITAAIGPALSQENYEVGPEFKDQFLDETQRNKAFFVTGQSGRPYFDLPGYIHTKLKELGVTSVETLQLCTYTRESLFYSYRRSVHKKEDDYGRQISAIMLK